MDTLGFPKFYITSGSKYVFTDIIEILSILDLSRGSSVVVFLLIRLSPHFIL